MQDHESDNCIPSRIQVLIDNYRESRQEGIKLAHSVFNDIAFSVALLGSVITGGVITNEPKLQLLIPFLLGGIAIYGVQKLRVSNLITCYMIYLEKEINKAYPNPVMLWNSELVRRNVSAGRQSKWGHALLAFGIVVIGILYSGVCSWPVTQNQSFFAQDHRRLYLYAVGCGLVFLFNLYGIIGTLSVTKKYTPEYIEKLVQARGIKYSGRTPKTSKN